METLRRLCYLGVHINRVPLCYISLMFSNACCVQSQSGLYLVNIFYLRVILVGALCIFWEARWPHG